MRRPELVTQSGSGRLERLSALDVSNLRAEEHGVPMHVAALARVEGAPLRDASGGLQLQKVRAVVEGRLDRAPRLRQVLVRPRAGLGRPVWADDAHFGIGRHVRARPVPAPGDDAALLSVCAQLNEAPSPTASPIPSPSWGHTTVGGPHREAVRHRLAAEEWTRPPHHPARTSSTSAAVHTSPRLRADSIA